jgi:uncharacterized OsmC-like protein
VEQELKTVIERTVKALSLRPSLGQGTAITRVRLTEGLACAIEDGPWRLTADLAAKHGGAGTGPNPGVLGRAALGSCLAIGYVMWAARFGVEFTSLEVEVQADYDSRGQYAVDGVPPGYSEIRYVVKVSADAPESEILRVLDEADAHSPYLDLFTNAQSVHREVHLSGGAAAPTNAVSQAVP